MLCLELVDGPVGDSKRNNDLAAAQDDFDSTEERNNNRTIQDSIIMMPDNELVCNSSCGCVVENIDVES